MSGMIVLPDVTVEVAFPAGAVTDTLGSPYLKLNDPVLGLLNTGQLADAAGLWVDISQYVLGPDNSIIRGSSRIDGPIVTYDMGILSLILDNTDRRFEAGNTAGPYVSGGVSQVTAMRAVRVRASYGGVTYPLYRGFADKWDVDWNLNDSTCLLTASDAFKVLSGIDRAASGLAGGGEATGARITRILNSAGWSSVDRVIAAGDSTVQATDLAGSVLTELQLVANTEIGDLYVNGDGRIVFRNRQAILEEARSNTSQGTFGDSDAELPYEDLTFSTDDTTFYNKVRTTIAGGSNEQVASDSASIAQFYEKTFTPPSDPILQLDSAALQYAQWLLRVAGQLELRFETLTIKPWQDPTRLYPQALGREIGDRITIVRRPPGGGSPIQQDSFIRGIQHTFDGTSWTTVWTLQSAAKYGGFLVLNNPALGVLNANALAY